MGGMVDKQLRAIALKQGWQTYLLSRATLSVTAK